MSASVAIQPVAPAVPRAAAIDRLAQHVPALDGVRGIAVLLVMAFHIARGPATALGWSGVDLFFVLSGFLITGILYDTRSAPHRARSFYIRRALRILPLYYGVLIVVFILRPLIGATHRLDDVALRGEQIWYWTYLCDWRIAFNHPRAFTFLTHFWSLSIEEQFYLVWPLLVWSLSRERMRAVAWSVVVAALALRVILVLTSASVSVYALLPARIDALAVGGLVALALRTPAGAERTRRWIMPLAVGGLVIVAALAILRPTVQFDDPAFETIGYTAIDWAFAGIVFAAATTRSTILESLPLRLTGRYSYGLYVYHPLVLWCIARRAPWLERSEFRTIVGATIGSFIVAVVSYYLYERPFLSLKQRVASR